MDSSVESPLVLLRAPVRQSDSRLRQGSDSSPTVSDTVRLSDCRAVERVSDTVRHCRTRSDTLDVYVLSDAVGRCQTLSEVGLVLPWS